LQKEIQNTIAFLAEGKTILYPTDTIWGIGCDATNNKAIKKISVLKNRKKEKNFIVLVSDINMLKNYISNLPKNIETYLNSENKPTTIIYKSLNKLAKNCEVKGKTIAIRVVNDLFCKQLIKQFGKPIISTSANISSENYPKKFSEISNEIIKGVDYVVNLHHQKLLNKSSKIIKIDENNTIKVIRN
jgi:L-threonylcarbamoyladenylate synthase